MHMKSKMDASCELESSISFKLEKDRCIICLEEQCTSRCIVNVEECARFQCILNKVSKYLLNGIFQNSIHWNFTKGKIPFCETCLTSLQELFKIIEKMEPEKSIEEFVNIFTMDVCSRHNENKNRIVLELANCNTDNCSPDIIVPESPIFYNGDSDQDMKLEDIACPIYTEDLSTSNQVNSDDQANANDHCNLSSNSDFEDNNTDSNEAITSTSITTSTKYKFMNLKPCSVVLTRVNLQQGEISKTSVNHPRALQRAAIVANAALQKIVSEESTNKISTEYNSDNGESRDVDEWKLKSNNEDTEFSGNENEKEKKIKDKSKQETASKLYSQEEKRLKCTTQSCHISFHFVKELKKHVEESGHKNINLYKCEKCTKRFYRKLDMKRHSKCHFMIKCSLCQQIFKQKKFLQIHHYKQHAMNTLKCKDCDNTFRNKISLRQHTKIHNGQNYSCHICSQMFIWRISLKEHIDVVHKGQQYKCNVCSMVFRNRYDVGQHRGIHLKSRVFKIFPCIGCGKVHFLERIWGKCIIKHFRMGSKMFTCGVCATEFKNSEELDEHSATENHKNIKAFKCVPCGKRYYRSRDLFQHNRNSDHHRKRKTTSFKCGVCLMTFKSYADYNQHIETHVRKINGKYNCNVCGAVYFDRSGFYEHIDIRNEKFKCRTCNEQFLTRCLHICHYKRKGSTCKGPMVQIKVEMLTCVVCNSEFKSSKELDDHSTISNHENTKSFKCATCEIGFYQKGELSLHKKLAHGIQKTSIVCPICRKTFRSGNDFSQHLNTHVRRINGKYECDVCGGRYKDRHPFFQHFDTQKRNWHRCLKCNERFPSRCLSLSHTKQNLCHKSNYKGPLKFDCPVCDSTFESQYQCRNHATVHKGNLKCKICGRPMTEIYKLEEHLLTHSGIQYNCRSCSKSFKTADRLSIHEFRMHNGDNTFPCPECEMVFKYKHSKFMHIRKVHRTRSKFVCEICGKELASSGSLSQHKVLVHDKRSSYPCSFCEKEFSSNINRNNHVKFVHEKSVFTCDVCFKIYPSRGYLEKHQRGHTGESQPFACSLCDKQYKTQEGLKVHVNRSHGDTNWKCKLCAKSYGLKKDLQVHIVRLHGEKQFQCEICSFSCAMQYNLKTHIRTHTKEKPFECDNCGKTFARSNNLNAHVKCPARMKPKNEEIPDSE